MMPLETARFIAQGLIKDMRPFCERIEIAGSIRREVEIVKDIELVCVPKIQVEEVPVGLFGETVKVETNLFHQWAMSAGEGRPLWIKTGTSETIPWAPKSDGKYWRGVERLSRMKIDIFLCTPVNWGAIFLIRTGNADFSQAVVTHGKNINRRFEGGKLTIAGVPIETPEEEDVFRQLGLRYVEPKMRRSVRDVRQLPEVTR